MYAYDGIEKTLREYEEIDEETSNLFERYGVTKTYEEMNNRFLDFAKNTGLEKMNVKKGDKVLCVVHENVGIGYKGTLFFFDINHILVNIS